MHVCIEIIEIYCMSAKELIKANAAIHYFFDER